MTSNSLDLWVPPARGNNTPSTITAFFTSVSLLGELNISGSVSGAGSVDNKTGTTNLNRVATRRVVAVPGLYLRRTVFGNLGAI